MEYSSTVFKMILGAGPVVQFVLALLVLMSVLSWTIILLKARIFKKASYLDEDFEMFFAQTQSLSQVASRARRMRYCPMANVFLVAYDEYSKLRRDVKLDNTPLNRDAWIDILSRSISKGIRLEIQELEAALPLLATIGNSAPFIGLFGTVWGIMRSFHEIGLKGSASLATVAPGISEALIATAVGLAAAIPAVIAYNIFMSSSNAKEQELQAFGADFLNEVERELIKRKSGTRTHEQQE